MSIIQFSLHNWKLGIFENDSFKRDVTSKPFLRSFNRSYTFFCVRKKITFHIPPNFLASFFVTYENSEMEDFNKIVVDLANQKLNKWDTL